MNLRRREVLHRHGARSLGEVVAADPDLGWVPDRTLASRYGCTVARVAQVRRSLGIVSWWRHG